MNEEVKEGEVKTPEVKKEKVKVVKVGNREKKVEEMEF